MKNPAEEWENRVNSYAWHNRIDAQIISTCRASACPAGILVASRERVFAFWLSVVRSSPCDLPGCDSILGNECPVCCCLSVGHMEVAVRELLANFQKQRKPQRESDSLRFSISTNTVRGGLLSSHSTDYRSRHKIDSGSCNSSQERSIC